MYLERIRAFKKQRREEIRRLEFRRLRAVRNVERGESIASESKTGASSGLHVSYPRVIYIDIRRLFSVPRHHGSFSILFYLFFNSVYCSLQFIIH